MRSQQEDDLTRRVQVLERALFGSPGEDNSRSPAVIPTMARLSAYMDAACWAFRALLASIPGAGAAAAFGRSMGWW